MKAPIHTVFLFSWLWMDCKLKFWGQEKIFGGCVLEIRGQFILYSSLQLLWTKRLSRALPDCSPPVCFPFCVGESHGEKVEQVLSTLSVREGDTAVINCTYTDSTSSYFPWYKQGAGKGLHFVIDIRSNVDRKETQKFTVLMDKKAKKFSLHITATQAEDSAIYFCAASTQCFPGTCSLSSNLLWGCYGGWSPIHILCLVVKHLSYG